MSKEKQKNPDRSFDSKKIRREDRRGSERTNQRDRLRQFTKGSYSSEELEELCGDEDD